MRSRDQFSLITKRLRRHKGRTALTAAALMVSSAAMLLLIAISLGTQQTAVNQFTDLAELHQILVRPNVQAAGEGQRMRELVLNRSALREVLALPGVRSVVPRQQGQFSQAIDIGEHTTFGFFYGLDVADLSELGYVAEAGSSELRRGTVVLSQAVLDSFFVRTQGYRPYQAQDLAGEKINLTLTRQTDAGQTETKNVRLKIGGVLKSAGSDQPEPVIFMSLDEVQAINLWMTGERVNAAQEGYDSLVVLVEDVSRVKAVAEELNAQGYLTEANLSMAQSVSSTYALIRIMLGGSGITASLVAVVTIINTLTTAILERTNEIGLMKALGATQQDVLRLFLGEAVGIGLLGGTCGVLLGGVAGVLLDGLGRNYLISQGAPEAFSVTLPPWLFLVVLTLTALVGGLSGLAPSLRAARLAPVVALKARR
jgi:putative ABC transport system permease protein